MNRAEKRRHQRIAKKAAKKRQSLSRAAPLPDQNAQAIQQAIDLAMQHHFAGDLPKAKEIYQQILHADPNQPVALHLLGLISHQMGDHNIAVDLIEKALALSPDYPAAHNNLGNILLEQGKEDKAVASFRKAMALKPDDPEVHYNLGKALLEQDKMNDAVACYRKTIALKPDYAEAHNNLGFVLKELDKIEDAIASFHEAIALKPDCVDAHRNLLDMFEKTNRTDAMGKALAMAKQNCPGHPSLSLGEAQLLKHKGDYAAARAVLEAGGEPAEDAHFLAQRGNLLGDLCDRLDDANAAFKYFSSGNHWTKSTSLARRVDGDRYLTMINTLEKCFTEDFIVDWAQLESSDSRPAPVFLVGFPRSGTTLIDTILRSHPSIHVVEEQPAIQKVKDALSRLPVDYPNGLSNLDSANLANLRQAYFTELDKHLEQEDHSCIVIDKLPLNIIDAGLIHRIFPQARFLFAQRHPCDCVLSCFMQYFTLNDAMANFLDLENAAHLYHKTMSLWLQYQKIMPLSVFTVRYEDLIEEFDETLSPLLDFLGVDWDDNVRNYTNTARHRGKIHTPSYNQVTQPLYTRARGRWERYHEHMKPILPTLLPWAKRFGYDE